jgi:hypothetical protein
MLSHAAAQGDSDYLETLVKNNPKIAEAIGLVVGAIAASATVALLLYPVFQAVKLRWWISGLRFGEVTVTSRLRIRQVYRVYLRLILYFFLLGLLTSIMGAMLVATGIGIVRPLHSASVTQLIIGVISICIYVVFAMGSSVIQQVIVAAGMWRLGVETAALSGAEALDDVRATGTASSALGEGLADALGVGGI